MKIHSQQSYTHRKMWENRLVRGREIKQESFTFVLSSSSSLLESVVLNTSVCCGVISFGLLRPFLASAPSRSVQWLQSRAAKAASSQRRIFCSPVNITKAVFRSFFKPASLWSAHTPLLGTTGVSPAMLGFSGAKWFDGQALQLKNSLLRKEG